MPGRLEPDPINDNFIFVSRTLAHSLGRHRYVLNGSSAGLSVRHDEADYFLFIASMDWADHKGLGGFRAATAVFAPWSQAPQRHRAPSRRSRVVAPPLGRIHRRRPWGGEGCALRRARGLLFPTQVNEAFGLAIAEALMSGTPVICSSYGACAELVTPEVGFICRTEGDYFEAFERIDDRSRALSEAASPGFTICAWPATTCANTRRKWPCLRRNSDSPVGCRLRSGAVAADAAPFPLAAHQTGRADFPHPLSDKGPLCFRPRQVDSRASRRRSPSLSWRCSAGNDLPPGPGPYA